MTEKLDLQTIKSLGTASIKYNIAKTHLSFEKTLPKNSCRFSAVLSSKFEYYYL